MRIILCIMIMLGSFLGLWILKHPAVCHYPTLAFGLLMIGNSFCGFLLGIGKFK